MNRLSSDLARLQEICGAYYAGKIDSREFWSRKCDVVLARLACSRVSLWRFDGEPGALSLLCFAAKVAGGEFERHETRLARSGYAAYFDALRRAGIYTSDDTLADPNLEPMRVDYLHPFGIVSMLDAAYMVNGRAYGVVCCEQTDAPRHWRQDEVTALRTLVAKAAMLMAGAGDAALWDSPSMRL